MTGTWSRTGPRHWTETEPGHGTGPGPHDHCQETSRYTPCLCYVLVSFSTASFELLLRDRYLSDLKFAQGAEKELCEQE